MQTTKKLFMDNIHTIPSKRFKTAYRKGWQAGVNRGGACPYKKKCGGIAYANAWEKGFKEGVNQ